MTMEQARMVPYLPNAAGGLLQLSPSFISTPADPSKLIGHRSKLPRLDRALETSSLQPLL